VVLGVQPLRQADGTVQRGPAHDLGGQEVLRFPAHLPHALVLLGPAFGSGVGAGDQETPDVIVDVADLVGETVRGIEQFAVHVDLPLLPGTVAHADRAAVTPAVQLRQGAFAEVVLAADPEHDLQGAVFAQRGGGRCKEGEEVVRLIGTGGHPQGTHGQGRVPDPRVAIVPVPLAPYAFGQRGGRGRHDRAARLEGQRLKHASAAIHQFAPGPLVRLVQRGPRPPGADRRVQGGGQFTLSPDPRRGFLERRAVQPEMQRLAGAHRGGPSAGGVTDIHRDRRGQH
jgi:hypothetical protein